MEIIKLAWRNLWRNKRRTLISSASVFFAIFLALVMRAFQFGSYELNISNLVHSYCGYFQIHARGYWEDKVLSNSFVITPGIRSVLASGKKISGFAVRLESFALASYGSQTKGVMVSGIVPSEEDNLTSLKKRLVNGTFLSKNDSGALVAGKLARFLRINVGDTLVLIGQGYHGESADGVFPVKGIVHFASPELDKQMVYLSLPTAQSLFSANDLVTSISVNLSDPNKFDLIAAQVKKKLDKKKYEVMTWKEMMPEVVQEIQSDNASGLIMLGILYMVVGFGIFGTILMMLNERSREFGMMIAIGMQKIKLTSIVVIEMLFMGILGIVTGNLMAIPLIFYFHIHPIVLSGDMAISTIEMGFEPLMPTAWEVTYYINQSLIVFLIIVVVMIFPIIKLSRFNLTNALKH